MFEGVLEKLLLRLFGEYVQEFNRDQLHVSIWAGDVVLTDLKLKVGALDSLRLPIDVLHGQISTLTIKIPWTRIASAPVQITIDGLYVLCGPQRAKATSSTASSPDAPDSMEVASKLAWAVKQRLLEQHEQSKKSLEDGGDGHEEQAARSYSARIISKIISNLQLTVRHVHVRYEDATTLRGPSSAPAAHAAGATSAIAATPAAPASHAFAMGITIGELVAQTTDRDGEVKFMSGDSAGDSGVTYKLVELRAGAVYWNSDVQQLWQHLDATQRIHKMHQMETRAMHLRSALTTRVGSHLSAAAAAALTTNTFGYDYILHPLDITMRAILHHGDNNSDLIKLQEVEHQLALAAKNAAPPGQSVLAHTATTSDASTAITTSKYFLSFTLPRLSLQLRSSQYRDCVRILDHFSETKVNQAIAVRMAKLPRFPARDAIQRKRSTSSASATTSPNLPTRKISFAVDDDTDGESRTDGDDRSRASESEISSDSDDSEDEFMTPDQSPTFGPADGMHNAMEQLNLASPSPVSLPLPPQTPAASSTRIARPAWCRPYWRHAIKCIILLRSRRSRMDWASVRQYGCDRKRYITLWMRHFHAHQLAADKKKSLVHVHSAWISAPLTAEERAEINAIERKSSYESIVIFRLIAEQQWKVAQQMAATMKQQSKPTAAAAASGAEAASTTGSAVAQTKKAGGWWGMLGFKQDDLSSVPSLLDAESAQLLASITLTPDQQRRIWEQEQSLPLFFKRLQVEVRLVGADFRLTQPSTDADATVENASSPASPRLPLQVEITRATWDGHLSLTKRLKNWSARVSVTKLEVIDCSTRGTCFEKVLSTGTSEDERPVATNANSHTPPLLAFAVDDAPRLLDSSTSADLRVALELQPIALVISPLYLAAIMRFFYEKDTTAYLWAAAANWEKHARNELITALTDHRELEIDVQVRQPTILLPTDCLKRTSTVLVSDLQLLRMVSRPTAKARRVTRPDDASATAAFSPAASILPSDIESLTHVAPVTPAAYDSFQLHFQACRLYTCASVQEWQANTQNTVLTRDESDSKNETTSLTRDASTILYIVDGAANEDDRIPAASAVHHASAPTPSPISATTDTTPTPLVHHTNAGFDVSLVMHTCIAKYEALRLKHARDKEKQRQTRIAELTAAGDFMAIAALPPLPRSYPLSKILIQGSLPHLNFRVCASTLEVLRSIKDQLVGVFFDRPRRPAAQQTNHEQTMLQLAGGANAPHAADPRKVAQAAAASAADATSSIVTVRNNLECGFIVDQLVVHILRDRVSRNARQAAVAAAAAAADDPSVGTAPAPAPLSSFMNPNAAPLFLIHITRMGGNFITNTAREITSSFQLASIRILDCLQQYGPSSKFAYLACSYPPPEEGEGSPLRSRRDSEDRARNANDRDDSAPPNDDQHQFSFSHALAQTVPSSSPHLTSAHGSTATSDPSSHLIRIRYRHVFHPIRSDREWESDEGGETEAQFLASISPPSASSPRGVASPSAATVDVGVSNLIDLDFNTLYVNWNPNTIAAVLAYMRYDETVQTEKETEQVMNAKAAPDAAPREGHNANVDTKSADESASTVTAAPSTTSHDATSSTVPTPPKRKSAATKKVRLRSGSSSTPSIISPMATGWSSAHKNVTVVTARLRKLAITFNKETEGRSLWRLEMGHSTVQHRHVSHPSPFLFYLMTSVGTGHRSKKESMQGFISAASKEAAALARPSAASPTNVTSGPTSSGSAASAHLSRDPIHTFVTKGALGNVHLFDLDQDQRVKYREMIGVRTASSARRRRDSLDTTLYVDVDSPSSAGADSASAASAAPVLDFSFASYQLEVVQRRAWCVRRRKEIAWMIENELSGATKDEWQEAAEAVDAAEATEASAAANTSGAGAPHSKATSAAPSRFPVIPDFSDTHLMLHVNNLRVVYLQQPMMELIDYFNEGIIGAIQARLRKRTAPVVPPPQADRFNKLSLTLSNPQVILPRNSHSPTHLFTAMRQIKVANTVQNRRVIFGVDVQGCTVDSGELLPDASFPPSAAAAGANPPRPPMMELECFVMSTLPQPDHLKQPHNQAYFDSITEVDASTLRGTISWSQYVTMLNVFNENIRAPPPVRPKSKATYTTVADVAPINPDATVAPVTGMPPPIHLPVPSSAGATPSLTDAPTVVYHVFDERPPMTLDIRIRIALAQVKFLLGTGYVATEFGSTREDGLTELIIQETEYRFQTFSSRHGHSTAKIHSITMIDMRDASRDIPFKMMLCPFAKIRGPRHTSNKSSSSAAGSSSSSHTAESELEYVQHDWPTGERDMQLRIFKPCGFVVPDFWMDFVSGFLFTANDAAFAAQQAMMAEWTRRHIELNGEVVTPTGVKSPTAASRASSPIAPLSHTTGSVISGYTPSHHSTANRPFRCFHLHLKNSRFIVLEDLTSRHCRALVTTCDATMIYTSEQQQQQPPPTDLPKGQPGEWWTGWQWARRIAVTKLRMFVCSSALNPVINAAHSVVTPLDVSFEQTFKSEKRYYEPRNIRFDLHTSDASAASSPSSSSVPPRASTSGWNPTLISSGGDSVRGWTRTTTYSASAHSPMRLEVHDQQFLDIILSSASGVTDEPIELRASYQDFKLITSCMETLSEQQREKELSQARVREQEERAKAQLEKEIREQNQMLQGISSMSLHSMFTSSTGTGAVQMPATVDDDDESDSQPSGMQTPLVDPAALDTSASSLPTSPTTASSSVETFVESVQMMHVVWKNQLTVVIINDLSQRYVPLLHTRILAGDALCVSKRKELDDEELEEDDDDDVDEPISDSDEKSSEVDQTGAATARVADKKQTALERARSFLYKLKSGVDSPSAVSTPTPVAIRTRAVRNVVDFKTIAVTFLLEVTYFNPKVVTWEPLVEPCQIEIKCQYETPNIKNSTHAGHHTDTIGHVGPISGQMRRRMRGAAPGAAARPQPATGDGANAAVSNVPAWTVSITCASRINVNITYIFLQHLYTTLQSWSADTESRAAAVAHTAADDGKTPTTSPNPANANAPSHQAFSPYFIRNLTGAEVLYRCRNIIRESAAQSRAHDTTGGAAAAAASNAYAMHDKLEMHSEFAADPAAFIDSFRPKRSRRTTSTPHSRNNSSMEPDTYAEEDEYAEEEEITLSDVDEPPSDYSSDTDRASDAELDDGLEAVHVLPPGSEEQLSLRLVSTAAARSKGEKSGGDDDTEYSAEDDVYRSILASRAPFSLRVRLAGGWVAISDLVVNKVGTTSYVLEMDEHAAETFGMMPTARAAADTDTQRSKRPTSHEEMRKTVPHAASFPGASARSAGPSTPVIDDLVSPSPNAEPELTVSSGYFAAADHPPPPGAIGKSHLPPQIELPSHMRSSLRTAASAAAPSDPSAVLSPPIPTRKQLLFVDVVLRDGSKVVTLRSPIELVNRTSSPLCFLLHAHPTMSRRQYTPSIDPASPYPDWQQSNSAFLQTKDAYAILGPVPPGAAINVPFALTHLDYVSVMPVNKRAIDAQRRRRTAATQATGTAAAVASSGAAVLSGVASVLDGARSTEGTDDGPSFGWSDTPLSQSSLMKLVHEQAARYTAAHASAQPPGVVAKLQCHKHAAATSDGSTPSVASNRWRSDSTFLLHVQAVHGSGAASHAGSVTGAGSGEDVLTLSLVFTPPMVLRNLFPYGIDFRVAYTRTNPAAALMTHAQPTQSTHNVLTVPSGVQAAAARGAKPAAEDTKKAKTTSDRSNRASFSMPNRLDQAHPQTNGKARYELWGHLASGQQLYFDHLNLDRDPYIMFRLDGFGWSERVPIGHLNPDVANDVSSALFGAASTVPTAVVTPVGVSHQSHAAYSAGGARDDGRPDTISSYLLKQHVARHHVTIEDNNGNPLIAQLESRRSGPHGGGIELDLYVQYWLINRTGLDLLYGSRIQMSEDDNAPAVIRTLPGHGGRVELCTYENQRYSVLDGWVAPFLPTDRPSWSDESGADRPKEWFRLPADDGSWTFESEWRVDYGYAPADASLADARDADGLQYRTTDPNGWEYAVDFIWSFHPKNATLDAVRRRKWIRSYVSTRALKPLCLHSSNMRGFKEELCVRVSPQTRGTDYHKEMHTKSGASAPLIRIRSSAAPWSLPFAAAGNNDGLLLISESQDVDVANDVDLEQAKWKRAAAHVMAAADAGLERGQFQLTGDEKELGPLAPHVTPRAQYARSNRYDVGVSFQPCPGIFHRTQMISFTPRFVIVNQLAYTLFFRQAGAHHRGRIPVVSIEAGRFQPFWWQDIGPQPLGSETMIRGQPPAAAAAVAPNDARGKATRGPVSPPIGPEAKRQHLNRQNTEFESLASIAFASTAAVRWRWTGAFPIDEVGELSIACRSSAMTSRFIKVKIMLEGATVFVVFKEENLKKPRYRLDNCTDQPMWYRQKLPYVRETKDQILAQLPPPTNGTLAPPSTSPNPPAGLSPPTPSPTPIFSPSNAAAAAASASPSPSSPAATAAVAAPGRPIISSDSLSPWLYLGPGESTPFAWQEVLVPKPYLLEVVTCTPFQSQPESESLAKAAASVLAQVEAVAATHTSSALSFFTRVPAASDPAIIARQQKAQADAAARDKFAASVRARLGPYQFHFCDPVQLDEIGYSLISMASQTFIDVYVEDDAAFDKKSRSTRRARSASHSTDANEAKGGATKIMKLVRKKGVREIGVAEAAAVLQQEERARAASHAAPSPADTKSAASSRSTSRRPSLSDIYAPSKQSRTQTSIPDADYVPVHRRELQVEQTNLFFEFFLPKFSLSLVDHMPRELALLSLRDLKLTYSSSNIYQKVEMLLGDMQIDNQLADSMFPVVLHQQHEKRVSGQSIRADRRTTTTGPSGALISVQRPMPPRPFLHFSCIRLTKYSSLEHYKYVGFLAQEFVLKLDQTFILACIPFLDVFYHARYNRDEHTTGREECSSMEDIERELGLPLANEEEYATRSASSSLSAPTTPASGAPTSPIAGLESELQTQVSHLSHLKAVLTTLQSKLAVESAHAKVSTSAEQRQTIRSLETEIARTNQQYHRLLEANQIKAMQIQEAQQLRANASPSSAIVPSPVAAAGPSYRASHVLSTAASWIEGADQRYEQFRTKHGNPSSKARQPYTGWRAPPTASSAPAGASASSTTAATGWILANPTQNMSVVRTLTALVNSTLAKAQLRKTRRGGSQAARNQGKKTGGAVNTTGGSGTANTKRTEVDDDVDQIYYLENVEINSVQCIFSFFTLPSYTPMSGPLRGGSGSGVSSSSGHGGASSSPDPVVPTWFITLGFGSHDSTPELLSSQTQALANAVSSKTLMIANAEDAHIKLTGLHITHSFTTIADMTSLLSQHFQAQLNLQLFELVGASHVLGNPMGLISNLGAGVFDLVNEPISGAIKGPAAFGMGIAVGVGSFFKYSVRGVASTASSLLGTMGNASATLTADPEYLRKRKLGRLRQPKHIASGLMDGTRHLAKGVYDGVTGIFTAPVEGAMSEGAFGFMKGVGRGLLGVVVKPVTGVFDAVTTVSEGIKNTTSLFEKRIVPQRPARIMYGADQLLRVYSVKELSASCFLDTRGNLRLHGHQRETYQDHLTLIMAPSKATLKENNARIKQQSKDDALGLPSLSTYSPTSGSGTGSPFSTRSRANSESYLRNLDVGDGMIIPSSMHLTPNRKHSHGSSNISSGSSTPMARSPMSTPSKALSAASLLPTPDPWTVAFVLTDHSVVCVKLDMQGNMNASQSNSTSSSAHAAQHASAPPVSKYARVLWSFLWIQVQDIDRRGSVLTLRVLVSPKHAAEVRKNERLKLLFPFTLSLPSGGMPHSAFAAFSSSTSYFSTSRANTFAPLQLVLTIPCANNIADAQKLESSMRLAQVRAQAESGRRNEEAAAHVHAASLAAASSTRSATRGQVSQQIASQQAAAAAAAYVAQTPLLRVAKQLNQTRVADDTHA